VGPSQLPSVPMR